MKYGNGFANLLCHSSICFSRSHPNACENNTLVLQMTNLINWALESYGFPFISPKGRLDAAFQNFGKQMWTQHSQVLHTEDGPLPSAVTCAWTASFWVPDSIFQLGKVSRVVLVHSLELVGM